MIRRAAISETKSSVFLSRRDEIGAHDKLLSVSSAYGFDNTNQLQRKASCACGADVPRAKRNRMISKSLSPTIQPRSKPTRLRIESCGCRMTFR